MGPINSAHVHYSREKSQQSWLEKKKKKKRKRKTQYMDVGSAKRTSQMYTKYDLEGYSNHAHSLLFFFLVVVLSNIRTSKLEFPSYLKTKK